MVFSFKISHLALISLWPLQHLIVTLISNVIKKDVVNPQHIQNIMRSRWTPELNGVKMSVLLTKNIIWRRFCSFYVLWLSFLATIRIFPVVKRRYKAIFNPLNWLIVYNVQGQFSKTIFLRKVNSFYHKLVINSKVLHLSLVKQLQHGYIF